MKIIKQILFLQFVISIAFAQNLYQIRIIETHKLSNKLEEISGLTVTDDRRIFTHNNEDPVIFELDIKGEILNELKFEKDKQTDFEGIAFLDDYTILNADEFSGKKAKLSIYKR